MGMAGASLKRMARERVYAVAIILSWALALAFAALIPFDGGSGNLSILLSRCLPDYAGVFLLISVPVCAYVFGKGLQSRTVCLEISSGKSRSSVLAAHVMEFLVTTLFICLSSSAIACFRLFGLGPCGFDELALKMAALGCACVAMASPACLAIVLLRDAFRAVAASVLTIFVELWSMALLVHPYVSPSGDLASGLPLWVLVHPAVALKVAVLPGATMGQIVFIASSCIGVSVLFLLVTWAVWKRAELR